MRASATPMRNGDRCPHRRDEGHYCLNADRGVDEDRQNAVRRVRVVSFPAVRRRGCCPDEDQASGPVLEPMHQVSVRALEQQASEPLDEPFPAVRRRGCCQDEDPKKI